MGDQLIVVTYVSRRLLLESVIAQSDSSITSTLSTYDDVVDYIIHESEI